MPIRMKTAKPLLTRHVQSSLYDTQGFVNYHNVQKYLNIKAKNIAHALGKTPRALEINPQSDGIQKGLKKVVYIFQLLKEMLETDQEVLVWLRAPNPDFDGLSPLDIIIDGKMGTIIDYLEEIKRGALV
jgi:hypothetical protein